MPIGDAHRTVWCASPFCIRGEMEMYGKRERVGEGDGCCVVREIGLVKDERDEDI